MQFHPVGIQILGINILAPALLTQLHNIADILGRCEDARLHHGFLRRRDGGRVRIIGGVIDLQIGAIGEMDLIDYTGCGGDQIEIVLPLQTLLDNLHVQQSQEAAPENQSPEQWKSPAQRTEPHR